MQGVRRTAERWSLLPRGSIVSRKGKRGTSYFVVLRNRWHNVPDPQTKANAELYRAQLVTEDARGESVQAAPIVFADFVDRWKAARFPEFSPSGQRGFDSYLRRYLLPFFGQRRLGSITTEDVQRFKAQMLRDYAPSTTTTALGRLRGIFSDAIAWRYLSKDPTKGIRRPRYLTKEKRYLTHAEIARLLDAAPSHYWRTFLMVAVTSGLRIGELVAMKWQYADLEAQRYDVREGFQYIGAGERVLQQPKTQYSAAPVRLTPACCDLLRTHQSQQAADALRLGRPQPLIFPNTKGELYAPRTVTYHFAQIVKKAGLPPMRVHDLRHTCAALWIDQGESIKFVQRQMRHSSAKTTLDVYGHLMPDAGAAGAAALDAAILANH